MSKLNKEAAIFMARVAEQSERFEDMFYFVRRALTMQESNLTKDE